MADEVAVITDRITDALRARDMTASHAADLIGMPTRTWWRRMRHPDTWTIGELANLARALGTTLHRLVCGATS